MGKPIVTPLGFLSGRVEVKSMPEEMTALPQIIATGDNGAWEKVNIQPGQVYVMPLAPGHYRIYAVLGTATSNSATVTIENGKTEKLNFVFGEER